MMVTLEISEGSKALIARHAKAAQGLPAAFSRAMGAAVQTGAEEVRLSLQQGRYGLQRRSGGLVESVTGWMIDEKAPLGAIGVPADRPAARYASILETGGTIRPVAAKALAIPISAEAKGYTSPRDMPDLVMISRPGKPPLLVRRRLRRGKDIGFEVHWVLVGQVMIAGRQWLSRGAADALPAMVRVFEDVLNEALNPKSA
jgi:hypothetical protein